MRGVGQATAAITVVNALSTGIGCAIGIELAVRASAEITLREQGGSVLDIRPAESQTPLVRAALTAAIAQFLPSRDVRVELEVASDIPVAMGLKSSSAVSSAVLLAVARASGSSRPPLEIAKLSAQVSRETGVSATGAFDDALAGLESGVVVTNNYTDELLRSGPVEPGLGVALWMPPGVHPPSPGVRSRFPTDDPLAAQAAEAALRGEWWSAMELNSELVERAMGYPYAPLREAMRRAGATASGTTGLGPAFAVVARKERLEAILSALPQTAGARRALRFTSGAAPVGGSVA